MISTIFKRAGLFAILVALVFILAPLAAYSGGPEPGPDDGGRYSYNPPPFSGDDSEFELRLDSGGDYYNLILVDGTLTQLGNSGCYIEVDRSEPSTEIGFSENILVADVPFCNELHPNDLMGFTATVPVGRIQGCGIVGPIFIEIIATAQLQCIPGGSGFPTGATAKLIVMEYVPK